MRVAMMLHADFQMLEVTGPMDVFRQANQVYGGALYEPHLIGLSTGPVVCSNGTAVTATEALSDAQAPFDIVMVPGSPTGGLQRGHREFVEWLGQTGRRARKVASVSNGAWLLARAGLADHRWMTTHWNDAAPLAKAHPWVHVMSDPSCLQDGNLYSSSGVSGGIHLALALVREDLGAGVTTNIARALQGGLEVAHCGP